jgi:hypothetical protein
MRLPNTQDGAARALKKILKPHGNAYCLECQDSALEKILAAAKILNDRTRDDDMVSVSRLLHTGIYVPPMLGVMMVGAWRGAWGLDMNTPQPGDLLFLLRHMPSDLYEVEAELEMNNNGLKWKVAGRNGKDGNHFYFSCPADLGFPFVLKGVRFTAEPVHHDECTDEDQEVGRCECECQEEWSETLTINENDKCTPMLKKFFQEMVWS